jgi:hypothetical protein
MVALIWGYFAITFVMFVASVLVSMTGLWPSALQVPWSTLGSFVETGDGTLLAVITMWGRIERYDRQGQFLGSWRQPFIKGTVDLATDDEGRVYLRRANHVFRLGPNGELVTTYTAPADHPRNWRLSESGEPQPAQDLNTAVERKIVNKTQVLFGENASRYFVAPDGSLLRPSAHSLGRVAPGGQQLMTYHGPRYFWPVLFPLPALLAWVAAFILIVVTGNK